MPLGDTLYTPLLHEAREKDAKTAPLPALNEELRKLTRRIDLLEGRQGQIPLRDSVALLSIPTPTVPSGFGEVHYGSDARLTGSDDGSTFYHLLPTEGCRVYSNSAISIPDSVVTVLNFDSEVEDPYGMHDSVNPSRITIPVTGRYHIGTCFHYVANATGVRAWIIQVNGTTSIAADNSQATTTGGFRTGRVLSTDYPLNKNDYVEVAAFQNSGGALNVTALTAFTPHFWVHRIS